MNNSDACLGKSDARPLVVDELLLRLNSKFTENFNSSKRCLASAIDVERQARALSAASNHLSDLSGDSAHQKELANCLDEVFGDAVCAIYLSCCGMNVPARMLLRRSLELGLVVAAYWDSPVDFWTWRDHDGDIRFSTLCAYLRSPGYKTLCQKQPKVSSVSCGETLQSLESLYGDLSNVVHPKLYNFSTISPSAYVFREDGLMLTLDYAEKVLSAISAILSARFAELSAVLHSSQPE